MKFLALVFTFCLSVNVMAENCNMKLVKSNSDVGNSISFEPSLDGLNVNPNCRNLGNLVESATEKTCVQIALAQNYECGQIVKSITNIPATGLTLSGYIETQSCWACR